MVNSWCSLRSSQTRAWYKELVSQDRSSDSRSMGIRWIRWWWDNCLSNLLVLIKFLRTRLSSWWWCSSKTRCRCSSSICSSLSNNFLVRLFRWDNNNQFCNLSKWWLRSKTFRINSRFNSKIFSKLHHSMPGCSQSNRTDLEFVAKNL